MKKRSLLSVALLGCALFSCVDPEAIDESSSSESSSISSGPRVYEPFGSYTAAQVEDICETYAERMRENGVGYAPECCFLEYDLGTYGPIHVNVIKYVKAGKTEIKSKKTVAFYGYHICTLPSFSYDVNVYIEGQGSFDLELLYKDGVITDGDIKSIIAEADRLNIRKGGTFDTKLEDFSFTLNWGYRYANTYDSGTSLVIRGGKVNKYNASFSYPDLLDIYQRTKALDIYEYADEFDTQYVKYEANRPVNKNTNYRYQLTVGDKTITAYSSRQECEKTYVMANTYRLKVKRFLELVVDIKEAIESSTEWNSMDIPEDDLLVDNG